MLLVKLVNTKHVFSLIWTSEHASLVLCISCSFVCDCPARKINYWNTASFKTLNVCVSVLINRFNCEDETNSSRASEVIDYKRPGRERYHWSKNRVQWPVNATLVSLHQSEMNSYNPSIRVQGPHFTSIDQSVNRVHGLPRTHTLCQSSYKVPIPLVREQRLYLTDMRVWSCPSTLSTNQGACSSFTPLIREQDLVSPPIREQQLESKT